MDHIPNEEYWPVLVVLDTRVVMHRFRELVRNTGKPRYLPDDMVGEIIYCFKTRSRADTRLDEFITRVAHGVDKEGLYQPYIDGAVAQLVYDLGEAIKLQLDLHYLYDEYGHLPYRHQLAREDNFNNVILRRIEHGNGRGYQRPMSHSTLSKENPARRKGRR